MRLASSAIRMNAFGIASAMDEHRMILFVLVDFAFIRSPPVLTALVLNLVVAWKPSILTVNVPSNLVCLNISFELFTPQR